MTISRELNQEERKLRKQWLFAAFASFVGQNSFMYLLTLVLTKGHIPEIIHYVSWGLMISGLTAFGVAWYYVYKKHGTSVLQFIFLVILDLLFYFCKSFEPSFEMIFSWEGIVNIGMGVALFIWLYSLSLKVQKINKSLCVSKTLLKEECQEHAEINCILRSATTLESLDEKFSAIMRKWPQFEPVSYAEYQSRKSELLREK